MLETDLDTGKATDAIESRVESWMEKTRAKLEHVFFMWTVRFLALVLLTCLVIGSLITLLVIETTLGVVLMLIFIAISMLEFLKERLIFLTDNNLTFRKLRGRKVLCQPRSLFLFWIWIPAAWATRDNPTRLRVVAEMFVGAIVLLLSLITAEHFTDEDFFPPGLQAFGGMIIAAGLLGLILTYALCSTGEIFRSNPNKQPSRTKKKEKTTRTKGPGLQSVGELQDQIQPGKLELMSDVPNFSLPTIDDPATNLDSAQDIGGAFFETNAAGQTTGFSGPEGNLAEAQMQDFEMPPSGGLQDEHSVENGIHTSSTPIVGSHFGNSFALDMEVEDMADNAKTEAQDRFSEDRDKVQAKVEDKWDQGSRPNSFRGLVGPVLGCLGAMVAVILFLVFGKEGKSDESEGPDFRIQIASLLMTIGWQSAGEVAIACFSDIIQKRRQAELRSLEADQQIDVAVELHPTTPVKASKGPQKPEMPVTRPPGRSGEKPGEAGNADTDPESSAVEGDSEQGKVGGWGAETLGVPTEHTSEAWGKMKAELERPPPGLPDGMREFAAGRLPLRASAAVVSACVARLAISLRGAVIGLAGVVKPFHAAEAIAILVVTAVFWYISNDIWEEDLRCEACYVPAPDIPVEEEPEEPEPEREVELPAAPPVVQTPTEPSLPPIEPPLPCQRCELLQEELSKLSRVPCLNCVRLAKDAKAAERRVRALKREASAAWPQISPAYNVLWADVDAEKQKLKNAPSVSPPPRVNVDLIYSTPSQAIANTPTSGVSRLGVGRFFDSPVRSSAAFSPTQSNATRQPTTPMTPTVVNTLDPSLLSSETSYFGDQYSGTMLVRGRVCKQHVVMWLSSESQSDATLVSEKDCDFCNALDCDRCQSLTMQIVRLNEPCKDCKKNQAALDDLVRQFHELREELNGRWYRSLANAISPTAEDVGSGGARAPGSPVSLPSSEGKLAVFETVL